MANLSSNSMRFLWWLRRVLFLWVRTKVVPADPQELELKPGVPVCYILPTRSMSDLLVLDEMCRRYKLPLPHQQRKSLKQSGAGAYIYMQRLGLLQVARPEREPPTPLQKLVRAAEADKQMEVQIVPVSVFWGRNPGREERSIFKLLFFDDEHAGLLQKFFIVLAQGRANFLQFGKPISLRNLVDEGAGADETTKKLRRVLRVHFRSQRNSAMGPSLPSRESVAATLLQTRAVKEAIEDEARKKKITIERAAGRAKRYVMEIAAEQTYSMVRLAEIFLTWLWNRFFSGVVIKHSHRLREIEHTHEIVYLPAHRSHMDYLLLAYSIYHEGFVPPHTFAGINLNFWPVGPILRRCGAFYGRRSFGGNRLYTTVFNEYVHYLVSKGHPVKFYLEGGRSRTGRLIPPKTGMLAMVVQSYLRSSGKPIVFVPVYLGYDKVMEVRTYQTELRGTAKRKESVGALVKGGRRALSTHFGKAYIGFGEPLYLDQYLTEQHPNWREEEIVVGEKPKWLHPVVVGLANQVLTRVNSAAVVSPLSIFALVILSSPTKALAEEDLIYLMGKLVHSMRAAPYGRDVELPEGDAREHLRLATMVCKVERFHHPGGDVIFMDEREGVLLTYYRNNVLHLVAVPSLIASFFQHNERMAETDLVRAATQLYPFLRAEFFLRWDDKDAERVIQGVVEALIREGLLFREGHLIHRPEVTSRDLTSLRILSRAVGQTLERYAISTALLAKHGAAGAVDRKEFETQCQLMAQRISILNGVNEPEFFDKGLFRAYIDQIEEQGFATPIEGGKLRIDPRVRDIANNSINLLSGDIRQSIQRLSLEKAET